MASRIRASEVEGGLASPATHGPFGFSSVNSCRSQDLATLRASHSPGRGDPPCLGHSHLSVSCWRAKEMTGNEHGKVISLFPQVCLFKGYKVFGAKCSPAN